MPLQNLVGHSHDIKVDYKIEIKVYVEFDF